MLFTSFVFLAEGNKVKFYTVYCTHPRLIFSKKEGKKSARKRSALIMKGTQQKRITQRVPSWLKHWNYSRRGYGEIRAEIYDFLHKYSPGDASRIR
jgi:hypothetical protein